MHCIDSYDGFGISGSNYSVVHSESGLMHTVPKNLENGE